MDAETPKDAGSLGEITEIGGLTGLGQCLLTRKKRDLFFSPSFSSLLLIPSFPFLLLLLLPPPLPLSI